MMSKNIRLIIKGSNGQNQIEQATVGGANPLIIEARKGVTYELNEVSTGMAPQQIRLSRKGKDLLILLAPQESEIDTRQSPDIVIKGYYEQDKCELTGLAEDGKYYQYLPQEGTENLLSWNIGDNASSYQSLGNNDSHGIGWFPLILGVGSIAGLALGLADGDTNPTPTQPPAQNTPPVAADDAQTLNEDSTLNAKLPSAQDPDGDAVTYSLATGTTHGSVTVNADGSYVYTPNPDYQGTDSFTYTVSDGHGGSNTYTVNLTVNPFNDPPAGADKTLTTDEDVPLVIHTADFGFIDPIEADGLQGVFLTSLPAKGTLFLDANNNGVMDAGEALAANAFVDKSQLDANQLKYLNVLDENGDGYTSFTFQVQDNGGTQYGGIDTDPSANTIMINVTPVNDAPLAFNQQGLMWLRGNDNVGVAVGNVLTGGVTDADHLYRISDIGPAWDAQASKPILNSTYARSWWDEDTNRAAQDPEGSPVQVISFTWNGQTYQAGEMATDSVTGATFTMDAQGEYYFAEGVAEYPIPEVTYTISDGELTDSAILRINKPPVANGDNFTAGWNPMYIDPNWQTGDSQWSYVSYNLLTGDQGTSPLRASAADTDADGDSFKIIKAIAKDVSTGQEWNILDTEVDLTQMGYWGTVKVSSDGWINNSLDHEKITTTGYLNTPQIMYEITDGLGISWAIIQGGMSGS